MATEFNYVARLDTSQIMSGLSEIRSQVGMALGGGSFGGGSFSQTNFGGGAASGITQMMGAMGGSGAYAGGTFTDPAMAFSPHYGMQGAETTLRQEGLISGPNGMAWAGRMAPPGVSAGEFAFAAMGNNIDRQIQAHEAASLAGQSALVSNAGGLLAGELAMGIATPLGAIGGGKIASRMFGAEAAGAGRAIGGLAAGLGAMFLATDYVGGKIEKHYAEIEQTMGVTRELADIIGGDRGLSRSQKIELGIAGRQAATSMNMDVNQFGDIMALSRDAGMLPNSTDPSKFKEQAVQYANAIREATQMIHGSLAEGTQLVKSASMKGITVEEAAIRSVSLGPMDDLSRSMYGVGVGVGRGMGFTGAQGGQIFSNAVSQGMSSGISGEERAILGGAAGVAQLIGGTQLAAAAGPMGTLQLMAARGGGALGGLMDLPGQAMEAMSQGGDFLSNVGKFQVHQDEYRRGIGAKGIRSMAMSQLEGMGDIISEIMPGLSGNEAKRMAAMNMYGMTGTQAEAYVGGLSAGPGGESALNRQLRVAQIDENTRMERTGEMISRIPTSDRASFGWGYAGEGAMIGGMIGTPIMGSVIGGAAGFVAGNARALWQGAGDLFEGLGDAFSSAGAAADRRARKAAEEYDNSLAGIKNKAGMLEPDREVQARSMVADLSGLTINMTSGGTRAANLSEGMLRAAGLTPVAAGAGTVQVGNVSFMSREVQKVGLHAGGRALTEGDIQDADQLAYQMAYGSGPQASKQIDQINKDIKAMTGPNADPMTKEFQDAATRFAADAKGLAAGIRDPKKRAAFLSGFESGEVFQANSRTGAALRASGVHIDALGGVAARARETLGVAVGDFSADQAAKEVKFLATAYGGSGDEDAQMEMARLWYAEPRYAKAKEMQRQGRPQAEVDAEYQAAYQAAVVHRGGVPGGGKSHTQGAPIDVGDGGLHFTTAAKTMHSEKYNQKRDAIEAAAVAMDPKKADAYRKDQFAKLDKDDDLSRSLVDVGMMQKQTNPLLKGGGRTAPALHTRTIGFGEQETAMSNINKSLERTAKMIKALDDKMSGPRTGGSPTETK